MTKQEIWEMTPPQLEYLMKQCGEHIEFTIQVSSMGIPAFLGGGSVVGASGQKEDGEYEDGYKVATAEDMEEFARILGA